MFIFTIGDIISIFFLIFFGVGFSILYISNWLDKRKNK